MTQWQVSVRQTFSGQFEWSAAYTHSRATTNAVVDANSPQPLQLVSNLVPLPWDVPNRVLAWAYLPLPWKNWAVSALADMRSGYPFSVRDEGGAVIGVVRIPTAIRCISTSIWPSSWMVTFHGYCRSAWRHR